VEGMEECGRICLKFIDTHPDSNLILLPAEVTCNGPNLDGSCGIKATYPAVEQKLSLE
jgi:hypothetical protein